MKIFKRPMFRKGGEVGGGIMTGLRENYQQGSTAERLMRVAGQPAGFDPLTQFLIQGGLSLASQPATGGGTIADIATAVQKPAADLMTGLGKRDEMRQQLALKGELLDIEQEGAERLAKIKEQNQILNERKKAIAAAGPKREGETEEDYLKRIDDLTAKLILSGVTSAEYVQKRFDVGQKTEALNDIYERYGLTAGPAESFYNFQKTTAPELTQRTGKQFMGPIKKDSKGNYKTRNKQPGIYYDPFAQQAVLLEATGEVQLID